MLLISEIEIGKAWRAVVAASQETYLMDKTTILTEGKGKIKR